MKREPHRGEELEEFGEINIGKKFLHPMIIG